MTSGLHTPVFIDPDIGATFRHDGVVVLDLLDHTLSRTLQSAYERIVPEIKLGFTSTLLASELEVRRKCHETVKNTVVPRLHAHLTNFRALMCGFAVRSTQSLSKDMPLHQDWSFVDETKARTIGVWIPLRDVDEQTGCLQFVKGSHRSTHPVRPIGARFAYPQLVPLLEEKYLTSLELKTGQCALFDQRIFHCSTANTGQIPRIASVAVLLPSEIPLQTYDSNGRSQQLPDNHFIDNLMIG